MMKYIMQQIRLRKLICAGLICFIMLNGCVSTPPRKPTDAATGDSSADEKKDIVFVFTGSDWSTEASRFSKNVLTEVFKSEAAKNYTVNYVDLLRNPTEHERETAHKNYLLFSEYAVPDVPCIVMQTAEQETYTVYVIEADIKTDMQLIEKINALSVRRKAVVEARRLIDTAQGVEKARAIDSFLNIILNADSRRYDSLRMQVPALDPNNQSGLKGKYLLMSADIRAKHFVQCGDFVSAGNEYKAAAEAGDLAPGELQFAWYLAAYSYLMAGSVDTNTIIGYLRKAVAADPQNPGVQQIHQAIKKLQKDAQ